VASSPFLHPGKGVPFYLSADSLPSAHDFLHGATSSVMRTIILLAILGCLTGVSLVKTGVCERYEYWVRES
jgi:hypothetical protein